MNLQVTPERGGCTVDAALAGVDAALAGLDDLDTLPVADHVVRFAALHDELTAALAGIDEV